MLLLTSKVATSDNWRKSSHWEGPRLHSCYNAVESTKRTCDQIITIIYERKGVSLPQTFRTMVNFGFRDAKPPVGSLGAPVTNCRNDRSCSYSNSFMISSNCNSITNEQYLRRTRGAPNLPAN